jgi:hypothetical protein
MLLLNPASHCLRMANLSAAISVLKSFFGMPARKWIRNPASDPIKDETKSAQHRRGRERRNSNCQGYKIRESLCENFRDYESDDHAGKESGRQLRRQRKSAGAPRARRRIKAACDGKVELRTTVYTSQRLSIQEFAAPIGAHIKLTSALNGKPQIP